MEFIREWGMVYDTIVYCAEYFNGTLLSGAYEKYKVKPDTDYYGEVYRNLPALPEIVFPFFYYNTVPTALSRLFIKWDGFDKNIDVFIDYINSQKAELFSFFIKSVFSVDKDEDVETLKNFSDRYVSALMGLDFSPERKLSVSLVYSGFDHAVSVLCETLKKVYSEIEALHERHYDAISVEVKNIKSAGVDSLNADLGLEKEDDDTYFSISLIAAYTWISNSCNRCLVGILYRSLRNRDVSDKDIDIGRILIACGSATRYAIIRTLMEDEELTANDISRKIDVPFSSTARHIEALRAENIIYVSRKAGILLYYKLNYSLLRKTVKIIDEKLSEKLF